MNTLTAMLAISVLAVMETPRHRLVPIAPMSQDAEILYGDPEVPGEIDGDDGTLFIALEEDVTRREQP